MLQPDRIKRFIVDEVTSESVKEVLLQSFMKKREGDYHVKAAQMLAIEMLQEGWKDLEIYKRLHEDPKATRQVGL
jgi:hypothetical protein